LASVVQAAGELAQYDFALPPDRIAQEPAARRDAARLLVLDRRSGALRDAGVTALGQLLRTGDCLVVNDTRVMPARLLGRLPGAGAEVEVLLLHERGERMVKITCAGGLDGLLEASSARPERTIPNRSFWLPTSPLDR